MPFWTKLRARLGGARAEARPASGSSGSSDPHGIYLYYRCARCGAPVRVRVDRRNDLNREEDGPGVYVLRKEVMDNRCFRLMQSEIWFDSGFQIVASDVSGGSLISEAEYAALASERPAPRADRNE